MTRKRLKKVESEKPKPEFKPNDVLIKNRELFLYEKIDENSTSRLIKEIKALNYVNQKPITLWINSPGGSTVNGLALINIMRAVKSPIITIVNSEAASMASQVAVAGNIRKIVYNGWIMLHDMSGGITGDYSGKVKYRAQWIEKHYKNLEDNYRQFTKLTKKDLEIARNGELWLDAEACLKKGLVDEIIRP
jgi:ATP-dependent Clp protease protease subunit